MNTTHHTAEKLRELVQHLAQLAKDDINQKGWSAKVALDDHMENLWVDFSAKNLADVIWLERTLSGKSMTLLVIQHTMAHAYESPLMAGVIARLEELIARITTTGSLLR